MVQTEERVWGQSKREFSKPVQSTAERAGESMVLENRPPDGARAPVLVSEESRKLMHNVKQR